jgi:protein dithiol:quinone oxidoreductase
MRIRLHYLLGLIIIGLLLLTSVYLQVVDGFIPCPLCVLQRLSFALLGVWFFLGIFIHRYRLGRILINLLTVFTSMMGLFLSGRQVYLQHSPPANASECGVSLQYMMQVLPLHEVMASVLKGTAECTQRGWEFLKLNMAEWSLLFFILFLIFTTYLLLKDSTSR